jgi:hypothetical protein
MQTAILKKAYRVGQGALRMKLWNQVGGGSKTLGKRSCKASCAAMVCCCLLVNDAMKK